MTLHHYPESDSLYSDLNQRTSVDSREVADGVVVDFDDEGHIVEIDIDRAETTLDLAAIETEALPAVPSRTA